MMMLKHSAVLLRALAGLVCGFLIGMGPATAEVVAYVPAVTGGTSGGYLVDWKAGNWARVVGPIGGGIGAFTDDGTQRVVTLGAPLSYIGMSSDIDCFGNQYTQRTDTRQFVFRRAAGSAAKGNTDVVEIGTVTDLDGCTAGRIVPFGSLTGPGQLMLHRAFSDREPMTDVMPGFTIAGFAESQGGTFFYPEGDALGADVVTLETPTSLRFQRTGTVVPAALDAEQWLMLQMPAFQRGYTRIAFDKASGGEIWLVANFQDGLPILVGSSLMIKPVVGASFGSGAQASRMWESRIRLGTDYPFFFYLYRDRTGDRVERDLTTGDEYRFPTTWRFAGNDIVQTYDLGASNRKRTWTPLARNGKYMFVFENESRKYPGQPRYLAIPPRINFYVDRGPAAPP